MLYYLAHMVVIYGKRGRIVYNELNITSDNNDIVEVLVRPYSKYSALSIITINIVINTLH